MSDNNDIAAPFEEVEEESSTPAPKRVRKPARKKPGKRGPRGSLTPEFWADLRGLYENGNYSQRDLVKYAKARGFTLSQPLIARKVIDEGWVKGSIRQAIENSIHEEYRSRVGSDIIKMLDNHAQQARIIITECLIHFQNAQHIRTANVTAGIATPGQIHAIPPASLRMLGSTINEARKIEAQAMGWNYKEGRPFRPEEDDENAEQTLRVRILTPEEEAEIQRRADADEDTAEED